MFGSMVLEVAIGVIFVYLLLSLIVTAVTELISGWLKWRSQNLWKGIRNLLDSGTAETWVRKLYKHPLIEGLSQPDAATAADRKKKGPSYIPSRTFAIALLESLKEEAAAPGQNDPWLHLQTVIQGLPDDKLRKALLALLEESNHDVEQLKTNIEIWFNNSMERVSGWYKRKTQVVHIVLAVTVTLVINVDTVLIVNALSQNQALRESLVKESERFSKSQPAPGTTPPAAGSGRTVEQLRAQLAQLDLPIGWVLPGQRAYTQDNSDFRVWPGWYWRGKLVDWVVFWMQTVRFHLLGWLLTAFALSLGAPFWFDMLNKVINIRSSGKAPEEMPRSPQKVPLPREPGQVPAAS
jgi:hypothetical protein